MKVYWRLLPFLVALSSAFEILVPGSNCGVDWPVRHRSCCGTELHKCWDEAEPCTVITLTQEREQGQINDSTEGAPAGSSSISIASGPLESNEAAVTLHESTTAQNSTTVAASVHTLIDSKTAQSDSTATSSTVPTSTDSISESSKTTVGSTTTTAGPSMNTTTSSTTSRNVTGITDSTMTNNVTNPDATY